MNPHGVIARRRQQRDALLAAARRFVAALDADLAIRAAAVFGSVARGDFNEWSDLDVLVVAERLPARALDRYEALGELPPRVQVVPWTPGDWRRELSRSNPIAVEAVELGVWLLGSPRDLQT